VTPEELAEKVLLHADATGAGTRPAPAGVEGLHIVRLREPTALEPVLYNPVFCLVLQGEKMVCVGKQALCFNRLRSVVIGIDLPTQGRVVEASREKPYIAMALDLDIGLIREMSAVLPEPTPDCRNCAVGLADADQELLDAMGRLFSLKDKPEAQAILRPLLVREIHYWLLVSGHGSMLRSLALPDSRSARIARVAAEIRRNFSDTLKIPDLAREAGMSSSAFHEHFRAFTGTSPLQYQKQIRLLEAQRLILMEGMAVTAAAFAVGYESPTQFSREYSRHFGLSPRQDLARLAA
jgi:AraC-like DNA-binding protein